MTHEPDDGSQTELTRSLHRSAGSFELVFAPVIMALIGLWLDRMLIQPVRGPASGHAVDPRNTTKEPAE